MLGTLHEETKPPFTFSASHKDMVGGTKDLKFGLVSSAYYFFLVVVSKQPFEHKGQIPAVSNEQLM